VIINETIVQIISKIPLDFSELKKLLNVLDNFLFTTVINNLINYSLLKRGVALRRQRQHQTISHARENIVEVNSGLKTV
jgi:hypothetical protein